MQPHAFCHPVSSKKVCGAIGFSIQWLKTSDENGMGVGIGYNVSWSGRWLVAGGGSIVGYAMYVWGLDVRGRASGVLRKIIRWIRLGSVTPFGK